MGTGYIVKEFFSKAAKMMSVYLDPYGENELKRMELADKKLELENNKINKTQQLDPFIFSHEISHANISAHDDRLMNSAKNFGLPKPKSNIGILPSGDAPPVAQAPDATPAQRASQVATVMAGGTQAEVKAPRTARFTKMGRQA